MSFLGDFFSLFKAEKNVQTKEQKRVQILNEYETELKNILENTADEEKSQIKKQYLMRYSQELSQNIFFDKDEIREIILKLSQK